MKKTLTKIIPILLILIVMGTAFLPQNVFAENLITGATLSFVNNILAGIANMVLGLVSTLVTVSGTFLSISINLTTHIGSFYNSITALNDVWLTIRNISSIFLIFMLLYSSIATILEASDSNLRKMVVKVILAGLFINFSLFFVRIAIDASNLVSLQFYRAISPETSENFTANSAYYDGGLSNVFMHSLKIPQIYQNQNVLKSADIGTSIFFAMVGGIIMMLTAAISFFAAAIAFTARTGLLLFLMALSPIYFVGMIFPTIKKEVSDKLMGLFKSQLIFMPAYLLLMYIALKLISSPGFTAIFNSNATGVPGAGENAFGPTFIGIIIQYVIALIFINAPLIFAIQLGAIGMKWAPDVKSVAGFLGQHSFGRTAKWASDRLARSDYALRDPNGAVLLNKALGGISSATYLGSKGGYDKRYKDYTTARTTYGTKNIKISPEDQGAYVGEGLKAYDAETQRKREQLNSERTKLAGLSGKARQKQQAKIDGLEKEIRSRESGEDRKNHIESLKRQALDERKGAYAKKLAEGDDFFTTKSRREAADAIRKELNKSKDDKMLDALNAIVGKDGGAKPEPKP